MLLLLPIISFLLLYLIWYVKCYDFFRALANTWLCIVLFVWIVTEGLSALGFWTKAGVIVSWAIMLAILVAACYKKNIIRNLQQYMIRSGMLRQCEQHRSQWIVLVGFWALILLTTMLSSQNNIDSLKYHLPRIMHWMQNKSVWHYATDVDLQVRYPSLTEYLVSQIYMLCSNDRMANLVQTGAYICSGIMVFGISQKLGVSGKFSFTALLLYYMMPMALAQAYTTQTDDVAGMFLLVYVYFILDFIRTDELKMGKQGVLNGTRLAACVMFGYLCKPTVCFVMIVFFCWMCVTRIFKRDGMRVLLKYVVVGIVTAVILYMPSLLKIYQTYTVQQSVSVVQEEGVADTGSQEAAVMDQTNDNTQDFINSAGNAIAPDSFHVARALKSPSKFIMNCLENLGRNSSSICFPKWNELIVKVVEKAGRILDYSTNKFKLQEEDKQYFHRDTASNPTIMLCLVLACLVVVLRFSRPNREQVLYGICAIAGFLIQCGLMGYTSFRTRYLIGAMAVMCPAFAIALDNLKVGVEKRKYTAVALIAVAGMGAVNTFSYTMAIVKNGLGGNSLHQYFELNLQEYSYQQMVDYVNDNGFSLIGLNGAMSLEYVFWQEIDNLERIEYVNIQDKSLVKYEDMSYIPECILAEPEDMVEEGDLIECHGITYHCVLSIEGYGGYYVVYVPV